MLRTQTLLSLVVLSACATVKPETAPPPASAPAAAAPAEPIPALRLPSDVRPTRYTLELRIDPDQPEFSGQVDIALQLDKARDVVWLHGRELKVTESRVSVGAESFPVRYEQVNDDGVVKVTLPKAIGPGAATLHFAWTRAYDPRLLGLYVAAEAGVNYAFTQFEDIYARRAFPGFDEPGFKTPYDVTLVVPSSAVAVANTPELSETADGPKSKRIRYAPTRPLPTYLLAWAVGPFDVVDAPALPPNDIRSYAVPMRGIAPKGKGKNFAFGLQTARELLLLEEAYFGIPYPFPKLDSVAVPDFAFGAMENAGEIHYREDVLLFEDGVSSEETRITIAQVIAHEQAHQWFGNLVTMAWWEDTWLNESFATWFEHRIVQQWKPGMNSAIDLQKSVNGAMANDSLVTARAIRQPLTSVKNIIDQFDSLTYEKGGGVLAMFERFVGAEPFRLGIKRYLTAHADGSGSTEDLLAALSESGGKPVAPAFRTFVDQAGVPLIEAQVSCTGSPSVAFKQSRYFPLGSQGKQDRTWQIPVCVRFAVGGKAGDACMLLSEPTGSLPLPGCPDWLIPNAGGAGYYRWSLQGDDLKKLRTAGYAQLTVAERIALGQALRAAVNAGALPIAQALEALEPIAKDPDGEVASVALPLLYFAREQVVPFADRPLVDAYAIKLFSPALQRLGFKAKAGESTSTRRFRRDVLDVLTEARDPAVLKQAVALGRAYAGVKDGVFHPEVVDADLAGLMLGVAVREGDRTLFEQLVKRLAATDAVELRGRIIGALAQVRDPERSKRLLELSLDPTLRKQEMMEPLFIQSGDVVTREAAWRFTRENLEAVLDRAPGTYAAAVPYLASGFCDAQRADEMTDFLKLKADKYEGMPKVLRQVDESMRLCAAQVAAQRQSAMEFFSARAKTKAGPAR